MVVELIFIVIIFNPYGLCLLKGNKVFCDHTTGGNAQELERQTFCMRSQSHERLWPPLLKLKFGNGWLASKCCGGSCKKFNSGFQFQFHGFQFQFHFQFHQFQFQFQFQFRNWNWNWAAIPIPELNWPQPCALQGPAYPDGMAVAVGGCIQVFSEAGAL